LAVDFDCITSLFQHNISQHCRTQHVARVWPPCCDMLRHSRCFWLKFEAGQIFHGTFMDVARCCSRLARFVQQCCARAYSLARFSTPNMSQQGGQTGATSTQQCCDRLAGANNICICCIEMLQSFDRGFAIAVPDYGS